ncbi:GIY-YIG nuclease family protein [Patescibacteria group bacterium]|nr:GIY-YIG nuclease family protein [Patescibacteria group bacterium]MDQ5919374.1 putative endonuclease [Patescibacteria group bacterium]
MWYLYILKSETSEHFYKGSTNDLERRLLQHNAGAVRSSAPYRPYKLVYYEAYVHEFAARQRESAVKKSGSVSVPLIHRIRQSLVLNE